MSVDWVVSFLYVDGKTAIIRYPVLQGQDCRRSPLIGIGTWQKLSVQKTIRVEKEALTLPSKSRLPGLRVFGLVGLSNRYKNNSKGQQERTCVPGVERKRGEGRDVRGLQCCSVYALFWQLV